MNRYPQDQLPPLDLSQALHLVPLGDSEELPFELGWRMWEALNSAAEERALCD